ncbi:hypothetical protein ACH3XW_35665 [Acanthocheilonema viteae]
MFTIFSLIIFSFIPFSTEFTLLSNWSKHSSNYEQLIAIIESEKHLFQQQQQQQQSTSVKITKIGSDTHPKDDHESIKLNLTMTGHKSLYTLNDNEIIKIADQVYFNDSKESIQNISEQQFREIFEGILWRHLELAQRKIAYPNIFATTNNYVYQNNASCQIVCQFISFCIIISGVCLLWTCTCCAHSRSIDQNGTDSLNGVNPINVPAPIDYSKPYMIKCDSQGSCYASPLDDDEVPPLPSYDKALTCSTHPSSTIRELSGTVCV